VSVNVSQRRRISGAATPARRPWRKFLLLILGLLVAFLLFLFAAIKGLLPDSVVDGVLGLFVSRQAGAVTHVAGQPVNVLVMGLQIGGASTNPLTDSMMVVSHDPGQESLSMLSIPRDYWVEIPGHGQARINEAFQDGGAPEAMLTVQQNLGVPVNYYALVSYTAFEKLIDDVGGVTVDVAQDISDPTFPAEDEIHFEPFTITKGIHHLNGHEALRYVRTRHTDPLGDIGRAARQQQVLMALKSQMLKPTNLLKIGLIMRDVRATIKTNYPLNQAGSLGLALLRLSKEQVQKDVLGYSNKTLQDGVTEGGAQVLIPNRPAVQQLVANLFAPTLRYFQAGATVVVENGSGLPGAAGGFSKVLTAMGAKVGEPTDADRKDYQTERVRVYTTDRAKVQEAHLIASMLGVPLEYGAGKSSAEIVVTLSLNYAPFVKFTEADWAKAIQP
jgi:LCP family protein required for cell wall assembly